MGVRGLLSRILRNRIYIAKTVDLVEEAKKNDGIELICDFHSFLNMIVPSFWKSLSQVADNDFLRILGGEYQVLHEYITKLFTDLQSLNIKMVMVLDPAKGTSKRLAETRLTSWKSWHGAESERMVRLLDVCEGNQQIRRLPFELYSKPVLLEIQVLATLQELQCEIIHTVTGDMNYILAKTFKERPKAFAVMSNDSDCCVFQNSKFIPDKFFDTKKNLRLGLNQPFTETPTQIYCELVTSDKVAAQLGFVDESHLVDLSIIGGHETTAAFMNSDLLTLIGLKPQPSLTEMVAWVAKNGHIENHPIVAEQLSQNRKFWSAVQETRHFYALSLPPEEVVVKGKLTRFLYQGIREGRYPSDVMSMHQNFYWHRLVMEDIRNDSPSIEKALAPLRAYIYRMVLEASETKVVEYGREQWDPVSPEPVYASKEQGILPANQVNQVKSFPNLRMFARVMLHQEPEFGINFFDLYGERDGFSYFCLRYLLRLCTTAHLYINLEEFLTLFATVFASCTEKNRVQESRYQVLALVPTVRCVALASWYQDIYRHAYLYLGKLLHVTDEFPLPKDIFSGAVFTAFFMIRNHQVMLMRHGFPQEWSQQINVEYSAIIKEKKEILRDVVQGIYDIDSLTI